MCDRQKREGDGKLSGDDLKYEQVDLERVHELFRYKRSRPEDVLEVRDWGLGSSVVPSRPSANHLEEITALPCSPRGFGGEGKYV